MARARLAVTLPETLWVESVSRRFPAVEFRLVAGMPVGDEAVEIGEIRLPGARDGGVRGATAVDGEGGGDDGNGNGDDVVAASGDGDAGTDVDPVLGAIRAEPAIATLTVLEASADRAIGQYRTIDTLRYDLSRAAGVVPDYPVTVRDGRAVVTVTTPHDRLADLGDAMTAAGMDYELLGVVGEGSPAELLTARQREVVAAALRRGYYDTPRRCTLTALAGDLDVDKSTVSGILHRAEERLVKWAFPGAPGEGAGDDRVPRGVR